YMENNFRFHFAIYRANGRPVLNRLIESLWLQFGPFMPVVTGRLGTANLVDQHRHATQAIADGNAAELRDAIAADITDGMELLARDAWERATPRLGCGHLVEFGERVGCLVKRLGNDPEDLVDLM